MKLGIDIGGTFTDLVLLDETTGQMYFGKTLTTYPDPTLGILNGVNEVLSQHNISISKVKSILHGTTLVTNAVIERKGAKTALITTKGFEDVIEIGREMRYDIYDIFITMPIPLVDASLRYGVDERTNNQGKIIISLDLFQVEKSIDKLVKKGVKSIAVCLLHSYTNGKHEQMIGDLIARKYPDIMVSLSSEVMPEIREYERTSATVMNAYVQPLMDHYLKNLNLNLTKLGFEGTIHIMNSAGRLTTVAGARKNPVHLLESGPAGGTMAGVYFGKILGKKDLLAFDMGGTTAKASMIIDNKPEISHHFEAARVKRFKKGSGLPVRIPVIDMIEIGAGGGSIAYVNDLGLLTVGPESASSTPGPACYGRGGDRPTVTDADLVLGFLNANYFLGGTMKLDVQAARSAIKNKIADPLSISIEEAAWGIHRSVNENMANAARVHIIEKGLDPRHFSMMAFGGAGPVHAFNVAKLMHAPQLIIPSGAGVLSALGFLVSPVATEEVSSYVCKIDQFDWVYLQDLIAKMTRSGYAFLKTSGIEQSDAKVSIISDMRFLGQGHEIAVDIPNVKLSAETLPIIKANFKAVYQQRYGRWIDGVAIESVSWRVAVSGPVAEHRSSQVVEQNIYTAQSSSRQVYWGSKLEKTPVYDRYKLDPSITLQGPCIIEEKESTTVVGHNSTIRVDAEKNIIIDIAYPS
jgi:N-methylhydantoinase A